MAPETHEYRRTAADGFPDFISCFQGFGKLSHASAKSYLVPRRGITFELIFYFLSDSYEFGVWQKALKRPAKTA
jgi:hypothetical protein